MFSSRMIAALSLALMAYGCKTLPVTPSAEPCPARVVTWMACPSAGATEGAVCQVFGPVLGCGLDEIALEFANAQQSRSHSSDSRSRFYVFAVAVTAQGAWRVAEDEAPQRPSIASLDF